MPFEVYGTAANFAVNVPGKLTEGLSRTLAFLPCGSCSAGGVPGCEGRAWLMFSA